MCGVSAESSSVSYTPYTPVESNRVYLLVLFSYLAGSFHRQKKKGTLTHILVTLVRTEFTLLPVCLEVAHLGSIRVVFAVLEGVFKAALSALADEEQDEQCEEDTSTCTRTDSHASLGTSGHTVPLLGQRLRWRLVQFGHSSRVTPGPLLAHLIRI